MELYADFSRVVIVGGPRCGKTVLSGRFDRPVWHTDEVILDSLEASGEEVSWWFDRPGPWVIEGVSAVSALAFWFARHDGRPLSERPCDCVLTLWTPLVRLTWDQRDMARQLWERWRGIQGRLRGCDIAVRSVMMQRAGMSSG